MGARAHVPVTEVASESEILRVLAVVESHGLGNPGTTARDHGNEHGHDQHDAQDGDQQSPRQAASLSPARPPGRVPAARRRLSHGSPFGV